MLRQYTSGPSGTNSGKQMYASQAQSLTPLSITYLSNDFQSSIHHNVYNPSSSIPQVEYVPSVHQQSEFSPPDTGLVVPVFQKGYDPIDAINHMMSFLTVVVTSRVGDVTYKRDLPEELSRVHNTFHLSNLKKCHADEPLAVSLDGLHFDDKLHFVEEPVEIVDREVKRLKRSQIPLVK
nr:putative reverse transcriptase domain-containing protein [Tanacetum cinerariifolium]